MDPVYQYFSENLVAVSKEELLEALEAALKSADYWRQACLLGISATQLKVGAGTGSFSSRKGQTA